jgi:hypothetical protein
MDNLIVKPTDVRRDAPWLTLDNQLIDLLTDWAMQLSFVSDRAAGFYASVHALADEI